ncbi:MAG: site-2 protease family protein [Firmicutes bacterium]|nr:site-2 protease family protein [Bacillota bacterium]
MLDLSLNRLIYVVPAIIIALTFHEYAHARVSYAFGDPTAKNAGRLTLNPLKHLDPIGALLLIFVGFGWAKPVPINPYYYRGNRGHKMILVSAAGPLMNLLEALVGLALLTLIYHLGLSHQAWFSSDLRYDLYSYCIKFLQYFASINVVLMVFNLIPIPPLDGSKLLTGLLPADKMNVVLALERYGFIILAALMFLGWLDPVISRPAQWILRGLYSLFGLA